ncbi:MAG: DNA-directed RNA polymerase subunit alpha [Thermus sp.]|uniref:DNA-directed RNA polymerase subunit alpha n=1 Tax=unclassified Thermus TaxID=2619321 RepID=UPI0002389F3B|nr:MULTISPECIES: DNA-directed RNA polymerase subunit alpha [unclassified Thermus]AEV15539.1 DNA-directed RNA polymerase subunit alpha [Thermus sp. CCB_US3_UF1]MCS6868527.1 DNA-directed RNA polymerase subunit alpha [Thermus sp.]MCS7218461.1 DNA-directed RNA polymerase subunit alpha [Thermus sp.]MCX7849215.1 DNA-directed RNA polymerase subunit alpha [Thermus sp.]MDW8016784.1 DNA-directed RNA polymerase subunit alpha [Thermus sp.]
MFESKLKAPVFTVRTQGREYGEFVLEPLERGFGVTLGNPLRRILLSSIPGTAVTSVYIEDVLHEFSTIPGVKEDVVEIILNLKELVVRFLDPKMQTTTLVLRAEGPKEVKAADFTVPSDVELLNPDLHIATLEAGGRLYMEVRVDRGVGYVPAERHGTKDRINSIPVDAVFSPVRRVAFQVEDTRLGQRTDLDKLTLRIWTDGSVTPMEALNQAVEILKEHLSYFANPQTTALPTPEPAVGERPERGGEKEEDLDLPLEELGLSTRVLHSLKEEGIESVRALLALNLKDLKNIPGIGERSLEEIREALAKRGFALKE